MVVSRVTITHQLTAGPWPAAIATTVPLLGDLAGLQGAVAPVAGGGLERLRAGLADGTGREPVLNARDGLGGPVDVEVGVPLERRLW